MTNAAPAPGVLRTVTVAPCRSTIALTIDRPRPLPPACPAARRVALVEPIEDVRQVFRRDARARIADGDDDASSSTRASSLTNPPARRVSQRVGREILQRLFEPHRIARHDLRSGADVRRQRHALLLGGAPVPRHHAAEQILDWHILRVERFAAAFEPRQIEQVADDVLDPLGFVFDDGEIALALFGIQGLGVERQRLEIAAHGRQRRHQLVRDVGQKQPPGAIGFLKLLCSRKQVARHLVERARQRGHFVAAIFPGSRA